MNQKNVISLMKEERRRNTLIALGISVQRAINTWNWIVSPEETSIVVCYRLMADF